MKCSPVEPSGAPRHDEIDRALALLNSVLEADAWWLRNMVAVRLPCNEALAAHPTVQVGKSEAGELVCGLLGLLNGLYGVAPNGWGYIAAVYSDGQLSRFERLRHVEVSNVPRRD